MDEFYKEAFNAATKKFVEKTLLFLTRVETETSFRALSTYPPINYLDFSIAKGERCFKFKTSGMNMSKDIINYQAEGYGFFKPFSLTGNDMTLEVKKGVSKMTVVLGNDMEIAGEITELESSFDKETTSYFRLILPKKYDPNKDHHCFIQSSGFGIGTSLRFTGLSEFICNNNLFNLFDHREDQRNFLIVDAMTPLSYEEFEMSIGAIIYSIGTITGYLPRNELYIFQSQDNEFEHITGFQFRKVEDSVSSGMEVVSPRLLAELTKSKYETGHVSLDVFSNLTTKARRDKRFLRALKIIAEGNLYPLEIRASAYSVSLETIKNIILEENEEKINPFKEKRFAKHTINQLKQVILPIDNIHFNNKEAVLNKLQHLNQVTNKDSFKIAFNLYGIQLTKTDEEALLKRNDFLHGRIPFEDEEESLQKQELRFITYKLHFLVTALIMKYAKFRGLLRNSPKVNSVLMEGNKEIDEPFFRAI